MFSDRSGGRARSSDHSEKKIQEIERESPPIVGRMNKKADARSGLWWGSGSVRSLKKVRQRSLDRQCAGRAGNDSRLRQNRGESHVDVDDAKIERLFVRRQLERVVVGGVRSMILMILTAMPMRVMIV